MVSLQAGLIPRVRSSEPSAVTAERGRRAMSSLLSDRLREARAASVSSLLFIMVAARRSYAARRQRRK